MFIINPLHARAVDGLFSTHPATEERVRRLRLMEMQGGIGGSPAAPRPAQPATGPGRASAGGPWGGRRRGPWG
jgi:heat shock protein HtpX